LTGTGWYLNEYLKRGNREFAICIGSPTSVQIAAAISAELGKSELDIANAINKTPLVELGGHMVPEAQFVLIAEVTGDEAEEGPFVGSRFSGLKKYSQNRTLYTTRSFPAAWSTRP